MFVEADKERSYLEASVSVGSSSSKSRSALDSLLR
jgi:hypothetical protein